MLLQHEAELKGMSGQQLARLAARVIMDMKGGKAEVEVVVLEREKGEKGAKEGQVGVRVRRFFLNGREDLDALAKKWDTHIEE